MSTIIHSRNETVISTLGVLCVLRPGCLFVGLFDGAASLGLQRQVNVYEY
jgi:hypothetical protein